MSCICDMHGKGGLHCRACCVTFGGLTGFDRHIVKGTHVEPSTVGLVLSPGGVWKEPVRPSASGYWATPGRLQADT